MCTNGQCLISEVTKSWMQQQCYSRERSLFLWLQEAVLTRFYSSMRLLSSPVNREDNLYFINLSMLNLIIAWFYMIIVGVVDKEEMTRHIVAHVRETIGPVAAFKLVVFVPGLPKTRSGKIARATLAALADGRPFKVSTYM